MANIVLDFLHNYQTGERRETEPANAYQYDEGHVLEAVLPEVITACEIHYWIRGMEEADAYTPTSITPNADNSCTVLGNIPNTYFETNGELRIYIVVTDGTASITTYEGKLHICQRSMPDDYVDDDPENEAVRVITEARAAAATATEKAGEAAESAEQAQEILDSIPADYTQMSEDVDTLKADTSTLKEDLQDIQAEIEGGGTGMSQEFKTALHNIFEKVAFIDGDGQDYLDALDSAMWPPKPATGITLNESALSFGTLNATQQLTATVTPSDSSDRVVWSSSNTSVATVSNTGLVTSVAYGSATITATAGSVSATCSVTIAQATLTSISAVYTQSGTVYDTDSLDSLKDDLVVTAHYSDSTTQTVADYTLSGTLAEGTSTITVTYSGKTSTFNVTVSVGYSVTNTLTNCSNTNAESKVVKGATYSGRLSADIGYELDTVSVTMGGSDITSTAYSDGAITVANVTGNIVINAVAVVIPVYTSSTGKEYTKNFTYDGPISQFWSTYGTMDELEELTLTGRFYWTGSGAGTSNIGTYAPKLRKFVMAPTSASGGSTEYFKFAHYAFSGIPATLTYLQLGSINPNVYCMVNSAYFRNDGVSAGLPSNNIIGNTNGIEIVMYSNQYRVNGGFLGTVDANTTIKQYLYTDGSVLTA